MSTNVLVRVPEISERLFRDISWTPFKLPTQLYKLTCLVLFLFFVYTDFFREQRALVDASVMQLLARFEQFHCFSSAAIDVSPVEAAMVTAEQRAEFEHGLLSLPHRLHAVLRAQQGAGVPLVTSMVMRDPVTGRQQLRVRRERMVNRTLFGELIVRSFCC